MPGVLARVLCSPPRFVVAMMAITLAGLALDAGADLRQQYLLGVGTWLIFAAALWSVTPEERAQAGVVVVVATIAEIIGSILWGVYEYRLGNLPLFVPPGHGIVYLTGLRISQTSWVRRNGRLFVSLVMAAAATWAVAGLTMLGRTDLAGAVGAATFCLFLVRGRAPAVYAGVFLAVAFLEIYGTAVGTWRWAAEIPGLGVPDGNPPSGAVSGYVLFDICALALAPTVLRLARRRRRPAGAFTG